jgi:hypothetical protein
VKHNQVFIERWFLTSQNSINNVSPHTFIQVYSVSKSEHLGYTRVETSSALLDNVFDNENETSRKHPLKGIGAFHNNPPRQGQFGTSRDSVQEVETSWDTRVYPKCSDCVSEPRENLNCYVKFYSVYLMLLTPFSFLKPQFLHVFFSFLGFILPFYINTKINFFFVTTSGCDNFRTIF